MDEQKRWWSWSWSWFNQRGNPPDETGKANHEVYISTPYSYVSPLPDPTRGCDARKRIDALTRPMSFRSRRSDRLFGSGRGVNTYEYTHTCCVSQSNTT